MGVAILQQEVTAFRYLSICKGTSTMWQRKDLCDFRAKLPPDSYYQSNHSKVEAIPLSALSKDTTRELTGLSLTNPFKCWTSSREAV